MAEVHRSLGRQQAEPLDTEAAKPRRWRAYGILVINRHDARLTWGERAVVRQLGTKLAGPREDEREERHGG